MPNYLPHDVLENSSVVANSTMNRERPLRGRSGYEYEIGFDPMEFISSVAQANGSAAWLDLCCGAGRALAEAAAEVLEFDQQITITGVDLVDAFEHSSIPNTLQLLEASLSDRSPPRRYDLITCVHGLHYVGDKLDLIARAASWLTTDGRLVASLDAANIVVAGHTKNRVIRALRDAGFDYDTRKRLLRSAGSLRAQFPWQYVGADDKAGPNYTGQPVVNSHYEARFED